MNSKTATYAEKIEALGYAICRKFRPMPGGNYPREYFIGTAAITYARAYAAGEPVGLIRYPADRR